MFADFGMETVSEVEWQRTNREIDDVTLGSVDENFVGEKIKAKFFDVNFFAGAKLGGGFLKLGDPEEVGREMLDFAGFVVFGQLLLVVIEAGGETVLSEIMHFVSTNLELDNFLIFSDNSSMKGLVAILLWHGDIIFDAATHRSVKGMNNAEDEVAIGDVIDDNAKGGEVVNLAHIAVMFGEFFV